MSKQGRLSRLTFVLVASPAALAACATPRMAVGISKEPGLETTGRPQPSDRRDAGKPSGSSRIETLPATPKSSPLAVPAAIKEATPEQVAGIIAEDTSLDVSVPPQPMPQFLDAVLGQLIQIPYTLGPGVSEMRDVVSLRGSVATSKRSLFLMLQSALKDYGLTLAIEGGAVKVLTDQTINNGAPLFIAGRGMPETPSGSRPVLQFFELKSVDVNSLMTLLQEAYPNAGKIKFTPRQDINTLVISGNARDVASAAQVIDSIDQPRFAGASVARISPVYWSADKLADAVIQTLGTEGYQAGRGAAGLQRAVTFLPVPYTNQVLLFSNQREAFERALFWINELDQASAFGDQENVFVYDVENTSADELGRLVSSVQTGGINATALSDAQRTPAATSTQPVAGTASAAGQNGASMPITLGKVTVDPGGNRLLFRGTPSEYQRWRDLVIQLDTPPQQVLLEMTIAEVTLTDETQFGLEWFVRDSLANGAIKGGTFDGLGLGNGGLTFDFTRSDLQVVLNAFSSNNNVNILSTPRLVARSGGEAHFQVGTDVPIITSQRAASTQVGGATDILQTVQYRQTGVLLNMRPTVYGDNRVDLKISQEVSSQQANPNVAIGSPLILNRSVETQVSLREGSTAVIGGLIQDNYTRGTTGVPFLKDIPLVGGAFRSDTLNLNKTELLILVTPYIVRSGDELVDAARGYSASINSAMAQRGPNAYTLLPWGLPGAPPLVHSGQRPFEERPGDIPEADRPAGGKTTPEGHVSVMPLTGAPAEENSSAVEGAATKPAPENVSAAGLQPVALPRLDCAQALRTHDKVSGSHLLVWGWNWLMAFYSSNQQPGLCSSQHASKA